MWERRCGINGGNIVNFYRSRRRVICSSRWRTRLLVSVTTSTTSTHEPCPKSTDAYSLEDYSQVEIFLLVAFTFVDHVQKLERDWSRLTRWLWGTWSPGRPMHAVVGLISVSHKKFPYNPKIYLSTALSSHPDPPLPQLQENSRKVVKCDLSYVRSFQTPVDVTIQWLRSAFESRRSHPLELLKEDALLRFCHERRSWHDPRWRDMHQQEEMVIRSRERWKVNLYFSKIFRSFPCKTQCGKAILLDANMTVN